MTKIIILFFASNLPQKLIHLILLSTSLITNDRTTSRVLNEFGGGGGVFECYCKLWCIRIKARIEQGDRQLERTDKQAIPLVPVLS